MLKNVVVIGFGSIGKRHTEILQAMDEIEEVIVLSQQNELPCKTIKNIDEINEVNPEYIIIASSTALHYEQLRYIENNFSGKTILVEKPLFEQQYDFHIRNNTVFVGYNLRFHPLLQMVKEKIDANKLWNINIFCGSYLPDWRMDRDYRKGSSARKDSAGGVLLDLSHELDYVQWLCGKITPEYVRNEKVSDLEIETDDLLLLSGRAESGAHVHISLNYFTRQPLRQILIDGEGISIQAELFGNTLSVVQEGQSSNLAWPEHEWNDTYFAQHKAIIEDDRSCVCTYKEGLETMRLIDSIRPFNDR